jgi:hypothetical protein
MAEPIYGAELRIKMWREMRDKIAQVAFERGVSEAQVVRDALAAYLPPIVRCTKKHNRKRRA